MKIAICLSGLCRGNVRENIARMKYHFPYDYFFSTWEEKKNDIENHLPGVEYITFPEPTMHYHPVLEVDRSVFNNNKNKSIIDGRMERVINKCKKYSQQHDIYFHRTKQVLGHAFILSQIPDKYDMIIRSRFDTFLSLKVDFTPYINRSYLEKRAIGFAIWTNTYQEKVDIFKEDPNYKAFLMDFLIMHRRDMFDVNYTYKLHKEKKLHISEIGWYQILGEPFNDNQICVRSGAMLDRSWMQK